MKPNAAWQTLRRHWTTLAPRERRLLHIAAAVVLLALLWWVMLAPALRTLRQAETEHGRLQAQWEQMQRLQAEAQALAAQPRASHDEALRALEAATREQFGDSAELAVLGERATLTLRGATPEALAQWLAQARINARTVPSEARLTRSASAADAPAGWNGTLVMNLPAR